MAELVQPESKIRTSESFQQRSSLVPPLIIDNILMTRNKYVSYRTDAVIHELLIYEADLYDNIAL